MAVGEKASALCLTTLEYAVYGSPLVTTSCPACGVRLVIKHDNIVNRVASIALILGMSAFIGYNVGRYNNWMERLKNRMLSLLGGAEPREGGPDGEGRASFSDRARQLRQQLYHHQQQGGGGRDREEEMEKWSEYTSDSAIDVPGGDFDFDFEQQFDDQLYDLLNYNDYQAAYQEAFGPVSASGGQQEAADPALKNFQTQTVDRIDQVLHQIDDIKKSIVEIDDELYHIAGATYANFNPNLFTLTNDYDELEAYANGTSPRSPQPAARLVSSEHSRRWRRKTLSQRQAVASKSIATKKNNSSDDLIEYQRARSFTTADSQTSSDVDSVQLEWDFDEFSNFDDSIATTTSTTTTTNDSQRQSPPREVSGQPMMTDEQKLRNMNELLDEAKRLGLLNNILDALQRPSIVSPTTSSSSSSLTKSTKGRSRMVNESEVITTADEFIDD